MTRFDDIRIGEEAEIKHVVTQQDLDRFVELTGDDNKLHVDKEYAAKTSFKKPVVHGMLGASFISTIIGTKLPGDGALWFSQTIEFILPVRIGDELTIRATVTKKIDKLQIIELQTDIFNQDKQKVTAGVARVKIVDQEQTGKDTTTNEQPTRKVALVIGATGGIGKATCLGLAKEGFEVIVHFNHNEDGARAIKSEIESAGSRAEIVSADIRNEEEIRKIVELVKRKFSSLSVLVNCATAKIANVAFGNLEWTDMQNHIDINVKSNFYLLRHCMPLFEAAKYGKVILMTSQAVETPNAEWLPYITAKAALQGFARALAVEMAPKGVRINLVSAGMTETELIADIPEKARLVTAAKTPLRRLARAGDIAAGIIFLATGKSDFMTGETLRINGGQVMI
jgi:3-oxoacyl-[acyl-carrier protein] reductase